MASVPMSGVGNVTFLSQVVEEMTSIDEISPTNEIANEATDADNDRPMASPNTTEKGGEHGGVPETPTREGVLVQSLEADSPFTRTCESLTVRPPVPLSPATRSETAWHPSLIEGKPYTLPVGLWLSGPPGTGKSTVVHVVLKTIVRLLSGPEANVNSHVLFRGSNSDFYLRPKGDNTPPIAVIFDDIQASSSGSLGAGEFLRLISVGGDRSFNIKGSSLSGHRVKLVIVITNESMEEWITTYNSHATRHSRGGVNAKAVSRRFRNIIESEESIKAWRILNPTRNVASIFSDKWLEFIIEFAARAVEGRVPDQMEALRTEEELARRSMEHVSAMLRKRESQSSQQTPETK